MIADISHYQGEINWELARKDLRLCIFRASIGYNKDDKYLSYAKNCGIPFGVYHYVKAGTASEAEIEAKFFYETATQNNIQPLFFVADIEYETQTKSTTKPVTLAFCNTLRKLGVKKMGLYIGQSRYPYIEDSLNEFDFIWIPRYGKNTGYSDETYKPKYPCDLWQYTSKGKVEGISGNVDLNKLNRTKTLKWFLQDYEEPKKEETNMAVIIGSARGDENGKAHGGKAGDQTGREVSTQNWYKHSKGWRVLRAKNSLVAQYMAEAMRNACDNGKIGYDQYQNQTLWNAVKELGYDPSKVSTAVETDCARLVRVCVKYACVKAGITTTIPDFYTANLASRLLGTGLFIELEGSKYTDQSAYLGAGDILVTRTKGHTVIVLTNGSKYEGNANSVTAKVYKLGDRLLKKGSEGKDVEELQKLLTDFKYLDDTIDGDFGPKTEEAVKKFQKAMGLNVDGEYGEKSHKAMMELLDDSSEEENSQPAPVPEINEEVKDSKIKLEVTGGSVHIRAGDSTNYTTLTTVQKGTKLIPILDANDKPLISKNGWYAIEYTNQIAWISGKYIKLN